MIPNTKIFRYILLFQCALAVSGCLPRFDKEQAEEDNNTVNPYISAVYEYRPAPGQFVNTMPEYQQGDTEDDMCFKVLQAIGGDRGGVVSLGAYGGYVTFGFDHPVVNFPGAKDFKILGNAIYDVTAGSALGGSCEPGIVMVSSDTNGNGLPDDPWYELAGSEYHSASTIRDYAIAYPRPAADATAYPWSDNLGASGTIPRNSYHAQGYFPEWIDADTLTFRGSRLAPNAVATASNIVLMSYAWGYADNHPNSMGDLCSFDISWAVDDEGNSVNLSSIDFVRVYTAINQVCGWLGETSTEISGAVDLHAN